MNFKQIAAILTVMLMCSMPAAGMLDNANETPESVNPVIPNTATFIYGYVNQSGGTGVNNSRVYFEDMENSGIGNSSIAGPDGSYAVFINVTHNGHKFKVYGIHDAYLLATTEHWYDMGTSNRTDIDLELAPPRDCSVRGFITDSRTGGPLMNVNVTSLAISYMNSTQTNGTGYYYLGFIPEQYSMDSELDGYERNIIDFNINSGDNLWRNISLEPVYSILKGYVSNSTGTVENVEVSVNDPWGSNGGNRYSTLTDNSGYYEMNVTQGSKPVGYRFHDHYYLARSVEFEVNQTVWLNVTLSEYATDEITVRGWIKDFGTSNAINGTYVYLDSINRTWSAQNNTDASGYYEVTVPPGEYTFSANYYNYNSNSTTFIGAAGETIWLNMTLVHNSASSTIAGKVLYEGFPTSNGRITLRQNSGQWETMTDGAGDYSIIVPSGCYDMLVFDQNNSNSDSSTLIRIDIVAPANGTLWANFSLEKLETDRILLGTVNDSVTENPVEGALQIISNGNLGDTNTFQTGGLTDFKGIYENAVPGDELTYLILADGYKLGYNFIDTSQKEWNWNNVSLDPLGNSIKIMGFVRDMNTAQPLEGLSYSGSSGLDWLAWGSTGIAGYYEIEVPIGDIQIRYELDGFGYYNPGSFPFHTESGKDIWYNMSVRQKISSVTLYGNVAQSNGTNVSGINVTARLGSIDYTSLTDANGNYAFLLPPGNYNVWARGPGFGTSDTYDAQGNEWSSCRVNITTDPVNVWISNSFSEWAYDADGDTDFDWLYLNVTINSTADIELYLLGNLRESQYSSDDGITSGIVLQTSKAVNLNIGTNNVQLAFIGAQLRNSGRDVNYLDVMIYNKNWTLQDKNGFSTNPYTWDEFEKPDIIIAGSRFEYGCVDTDFDGLYNHLLFNITVQVLAHGNYSTIAMLNHMGPRDDSEKMMQVHSEELDVGTYTFNFTFSGTNIRSDGYHLGTVDVMLFNGSVDMEGGNAQSSEITYVPYNYTRFQHYPVDSTVYGWVKDSGGSALEGIQVQLYNVSSRTMNSTKTNSSGYYELGGWNGTWFLVMNDMTENSPSIYQSNLTELNMLSGKSVEQSRNLFDSLPDHMVRTITFDDWGNITIEEIIYIEGDNETVRFEMDADNMGDGDGFLSGLEANNLMQLIDSQITWPDRTDESLKVDGIFYNIESSSHTKDLGIVGPDDSKEPVFIHQVANFSANQTINVQATHWLDMNMTYDDVNIGLFTNNNVTLVSYVQLPGAWGMTAHQPTSNVSITGTNYLTVDPDIDHDLLDSNRSEWVNITLQDVQPVTTGKLRGKITLFGSSDHSGVIITVNNITTDAEVATGVTNSNGEYQIYGLPVGTYNVTASRPDYKPKTTNTTISPGNTSWADFTLFSFPPVIFHNQHTFSAENNTAIPLIYANVYDYYGEVGDVTLWITNVGGSTVVKPMEKFAINSYKALIDPQPTIGTVQYHIMANDTVGNSAQTGVYFIDVHERVPPQFSNLVITSNPTEFNDTTTIAVDVTDNTSPTVTVCLKVTSPSAIVTNTSMTLTGGNTFSRTNKYLELGTYNFEIWANDSFNNFNHIGGSFTVQDHTAPVISGITTSPSVPEFGDEMNITANVTDIAGIGNTSVEVRYPNGTVMGNLTMVHGSANAYYMAFTCPVAGLYNFTIWARDINFQWASSPGKFWINDTTLPTINNVTAASIEFGGEINITADINDLAGLNNVSIQVFGPSDIEIFNNSMNKGSYWYRFVPSRPGIYNFTIWVIDGNNLTNSTKSSFSALDTTPPIFINVNVVPKVQEVKGFVNVRAVMDDLDSVSTCYLNLTSPYGSWLSNESIPATGNTFSLNRTYNLLGDYVFIIWAFDPSGNYNSYSGTVSTEDTQNPVANAGIDRTVPSGTTVTLDASASTDNYGIENYTWTLTDNGVQTLYGMLVDYTFITPGTYNILLTVVDHSDLSSTDTKIITVTSVATLGVVTGTVLDGKGVPISGVTVYVKDSAPRIEAVTDNTGSFILDNVPQGERTIVFVHPDYKRTEVVVTVVAGGSVSTGDITLSPGDNSSACGVLLLIFVVVGVLVLYFINKKRKAAKKASETVIDEIFYMSTDGRLIKHFTRRLKPDMDQDILSGMLVAVQDFIKDSFRGEEGGLEELKFGKFQIVLGRGKYTIIAALILGEDIKPFRPQIEKCLRDIETKFEHELKSWDGQVDRLTPSFKYIDDLIDGKYA